MVRRWLRYRDPWEREYAMRGRLWRASTRATWPSPEGAPWILDLGCGDGKAWDHLQGLAPKVVGLDRAASALGLLRTQWPSAQLLRGDAARLPIRSASAPAIVARYVLGALAEPERAQMADEVWRVLAPGGSLFLEEFGPKDFRATSGEEIEPGTRERNHGILTHYFERDELLELLPAAPRRLDEESWLQRTKAGSQRRQAWRATWTKPG